MSTFKFLLCFMLSSSLVAGVSFISVGRDNAPEAVPLDIVVKGVTFRMFWAGKDVEEIRLEGHSLVCPAVSQHLGKSHNCEELISVVLQTLIIKNQWGAAEYGAAYLDCVYEAIHNDDIFRGFKSDFRYQNIVESLGPLRATEFLRHVFNQSPDLFYDELYYERVRANDYFGTPEKIKFAVPSKVDVGGSADLIERELGNTIIRYVKVVSDLRSLFNVLQDNSIRSIAEIGIGFGGQAQTLLSHPTITPPMGSAPGRQIDYYFFDLPLVQQLTQKYLSHFPWLGLHKFHFMENDWGADGTDQSMRFDLCISNYAFSELSIALQDGYLERVLRRCRRGYILYNTIGEDVLGSYTVYEFAERIRQQTLFSPFRESSFKKEFPGDVMNSTVYSWIATF